MGEQLYLAVPLAVTVAPITLQLKQCSWHLRIQPREEVDLRVADPDRDRLFVPPTVPFFTVSTRRRPIPGRHKCYHVERRWSTDMSFEVVPPVLLRCPCRSRRSPPPGPRHTVDHAVVDAVWGVGAVVLGGGLAVYGAAFQRKTRNL